jgi:hypothetical protein
MKITVIHNTYARNEHVRESLTLNVKALKDSGLDYQYIVFNDNGDPLIKQDIEGLIVGKVEYIYSDYNYGMKMCSGGWIGAQPYVKGDLIHNIGQDDVYTALFYRSMVERLQDPDIYLAYANGFKVDSNLTFRKELLGPLQELDYSQPSKVLDFWFVRQGDTYTQARNFIPAPGVVYKKKIHDIIGLPDLENFRGSADFENWVRVLFSNLGVSYDFRPLWLYRISEYSLGTKPLAEKETPNWNNLILKKYQEWLTQSLQAGQAL